MDNKAGKIVTGRVLKSNLAEAEKQLEYRFCKVLGVGPDPDERYWRVTWQEPSEKEVATIEALAKAFGIK